MKRLILAALTTLPLILVNAQEKPLTPEQIEKENEATKVVEAQDSLKSAVDSTVVNGVNTVVVDSTKVYTSKSVVENSGFARTVGFEGVWTIELNLVKNELVLTGGKLNNLEDKLSSKLNLTVYYSDKPFDLKNPNLVGEPFGQIEVDPIEAKASKTDQSYIIPLALTNPPKPGTYYPYIALGAQDPTSKEFGVIDVKVFSEGVVLP